MSILNNKNIIAVVPYFNEENTIENVISETLKYVDLIIAVDDGSTDNSFNRIKKYKNIVHCSLKKNSGKGAALKTGFLKSIELNSDFTVTIDADLQHPPSYIPNLLAEIENFDIIIGSRKRDFKKMPIQRIASNFLTSFLLSLKTGQKIFDSQSGFRVYRTNILIDILPFYSGFEAESEMIVRAARKKYRIGNEFIPTIYGNDNSKMNSIQAIKGFIKVLLLKNRN